MTVAIIGLFGAVIAIAVCIFWIWMLIDCLHNPRLQGTEKLIWILVILVLHVLGAVLYYFIEREQRVV
jgi:uncharacterized RDD family membrane protein YckC